MINELVCEGCGDCSVQSNCISIEPLETEFGRKRSINQSSCNKDFSCVKGYCPSFVSVMGGSVRKPGARPSTRASDERFADLPATRRSATTTSPSTCWWPGIGGTGVITVGAMLSPWRPTWRARAARSST